MSRTRVPPQGWHGALRRLQNVLRAEADSGGRERDEFVNFLGHELRRPLAAIQSAAEVLERCAGDAAMEGEARAVIVRQTRHLTGVLNDLLEILRVAAGHAILVGGTQELVELVEQMKESLQPAPESSSIGLRTAATRSLSPRLRQRTMLLAGHTDEQVAALREILEPCARQISVVPGDEDALPRLLTLDPEVAIIDVDSLVAGPGFARRARAAGYAGRMVALGAKQQPDAARTGGFDRFVAKPATPDQLHTAIFEN